MQSNLLSTYCLDACGSQLWLFSNKASDVYFVPGVKLLGNYGGYLIIHTVDFYIPSMLLLIDAIFEKRCLKFIWSSINSSDGVVKSLSLSDTK